MKKWAKKEIEKDDFPEIGKVNTKKIFSKKRKKEKKEKRLEITLIVILAVMFVGVLIPYFLKK